MDPKKLESLFDVLTDKLLERLKNGEATAADMNVARAFLKDNNIEVSDVRALAPLALALTDVLPFEAPDEAPKQKRKGA